MASQGRYSDANALQFGATAADTQGRATHVAKHKKRNKGLHIVFDPVARQYDPVYQLLPLATSHYVAAKNGCGTQKVCGGLSAEKAGAQRERQEVFD